MKAAVSRGLWALGLVVGAGLAGAQSPASLVVRAENPLALERHDETIALPWSDLRTRLPGIAANRVRVRALGGAEVVTQAYDADLDGAPDSLLFQSSFFPKETRTFVVEAAAPTVAPKSRVHVKYVPERTDVAWENDRIAFRTYGQLLWKLENLHSSGVDVWVKRTRELVLDKWYGGGHDFYHQDRGEGADFYKVGPTLGAGATAVWRNGQLHRAENFKSHRIVADGPIRAVFDLEFDPWDAAGLRVTETKRISIDAGQNLYRQESVFRAAGADSIPYALGFVKRNGLVGSMSRAQGWAWLSGWGPMDVKYGEGGHGDLGTAVMLERARETDVKETDDHYLALAAARSGQRVVHYVGAGWTGSRDFAGVEEWNAYLADFARRLEQPIRVTVGATAAAAGR